MDPMLTLTYWLERVSRLHCSLIYGLVTSQKRLKVFQT